MSLPALSMCPGTDDTSMLALLVSSSTNFCDICWLDPGFSFAIEATKDVLSTNRMILAKHERACYIHQTREYIVSNDQHMRNTGIQFTREPRPPTSNTLWYKGGNRCLSRVCEEKESIPRSTKDTINIISDTSFKTEQNTTDSQHKQQESPPRQIRNQVAYPRAHSCEPCCRYMLSRYISCEQIRRLLVRWCLGPVVCASNHGKI